MCLKQECVPCTRHRKGSVRKGTGIVMGVYAKLLIPGESAIGDWSKENKSDVASGRFEIRAVRRGKSACFGGVHYF